jgi:hypothetical protein
MIKGHYHIETELLKFYSPTVLFPSSTIINFNIYSIFTLHEAFNLETAS